jgi:hypothetical protein
VADEPKDKKSDVDRAQLKELRAIRALLQKILDELELSNGMPR